MKNLTNETKLKEKYILSIKKTTTIGFISLYFRKPIIAIIWKSIWKNALLHDSKNC